VGEKVYAPFSTITSFADTRVEFSVIGEEVILSSSNRMSSRFTIKALF
jgi:hypothetical protein